MDRRLILVTLILFLYHCTRMSTEFAVTYLLLLFIRDLFILLPSRRRR